MRRWTKSGSTHAFNQEDTLRGDNLIQLLVEDLEQIFRALFVLLFPILLYPLPCAVWQRVRAHVQCTHARMHVCREGGREGGRGGERESVGR